jgi:hypothetical protein
VTRARLHLVATGGALVAPPEDEPTCPDCGAMFASRYYLAAHACETRIRRDVRLGAVIVGVALVLAALLIAAAIVLFTR